MKTIRKKMIVFIITPALIVYVLILGGSLWFLRSISLDSVHNFMTRRALNYAGRFDGFLREAAAIADTTAAALGRIHRPSEKDILHLLRAGMTRRPFIYGACAAFEPGTIREEGVLYAPYAFREGDLIREMNITREVYDWYADPKWTWFQQPKSNGRPEWSAPYFDDGAGNILMTTYSAPFYAESQFRGVATVDIDLTHLRATIGEKIANDSEFVILAANGHFVFAPQSDWILNQTIYDVARNTSNRKLEELIPTLLSGQSGAATVPGWTSPEKQLLFFAPITSTGWTFLAYMPESVVLAGIHRQMTIAASALAGTLALIIASIVYVSGHISRPLATLTSGVSRIAAGDLDARVTTNSSRDELGILANAFNSMASKLREHVERLAEEEASRRKLERDLEIAREIQRGLLPARHPELPGYDVAGWTRSADQTGGDYYDWQSLPDGTIVISLADVTGHGIGPALVTAACRAYARASFSQSPNLDGALNQINSLLYEDLQGGRFVTYVAALINPKIHQIQILSAGHGPLLIFQTASGQVLEMNAHHIPLGITFDSTHGPPSAIQLSSGDMVMFITDGFFEWANPAGELYGLERLNATIRAVHDRSSREIIERILDDVLHFADGTKQLDDLTAVVIKRI